MSSAASPTSSILGRIPDERIATLSRGYASEVAARRARGLLFAACVAAAVAASAWVGEVDIAKFVNGLPRLTSYFHDILPKLSLQSLGHDIAEWYWGWRSWLGLLFDTLLVAYVGTALGALGGFVLAFLASANTMHNPVARFVVRRYLEICRTVPEIVFALLFVYAIGLGPMPGVLAIAIHTTGALGKLFAEVVENADMRPTEGVVASGGGWLHSIRFGILPQVLSNFASYALLRFEINVRSASVMGFVGAGGIGRELLASIRQFYYSDVSAILLMIVVTVMIIDLLTEALRHRLLELDKR